jgi:hypothetical protein
MFGDHIARAMALERQRDLVPELRELEHNSFDIGAGEINGTRAVDPGSPPLRRARFRFARASTRRATGENQPGRVGI